MGGLWAKPSAKLLGKDLFYCAYHESTQIMDGGAGLPEELRNQFMNDMYSMIRHVSSKEELEVKISACIAKYGHNKNSLNYINSLAGIKKHLCRPYTQGLFTLRHTATQRSEGFNDKIKGHASLQDMLSDADLVTLHDHMDTLNRSNNKRAMDELAKLLNKMMRWSTRFESAVQESICLSTNVESCDDIGNGCFRVTQRDNTETKIIHLGQLYTIPTCDCGFWTSFFILCLCIVQALRVSPKGSLSDAFDVSNVHPFHRIEVHPMWKEALCKVKRADYEKREPHGSDNIDQVNSMVQGTVQHEC
jgi:hypothetical protein